MRISIYLFLLFICLSSQVYAQDPPTVSGETIICSGSSTTLTANGEPGASFSWYDAEIGGNLLATTAQYTTNILTLNTHFYVEQTTGSGTSPRADVLVFVSPIPSPLSPENVIASPPIICLGESSNLSALVDFSIDQAVHWYDAMTGGNLLGTSYSGENFIIQPTQTSTYYAQSQLLLEEVVFNYTGGPQTFTVPEGVFSLSINANGAQGGNTYSTLGPGLGGRVEANMNVTPGQVLNIYVGGMGQSYAGYSSQLAGGWNGGAHGSSIGQGGGGGGATDIRIGGTALSNRILVAGGAGGKGPTCSSSGLKPHGGGLTGGAGSYCNSGPAEGTRGLGGSQTEGGRKGCWWNESYCGQTGSLGQGGNGGNYRGGGGGGGYYGGGGATDKADGGGGSSYTDQSFTNVVHNQGVNSGHGNLIIKYTAIPKDCASTTRIPITINVEQIPNVIASSDTYNCPGNGVAISASGANTYTWQPSGLEGQSVVVDPTATTIYTVTGTTGNCSNTDEMIVNVSTLSTSADTEICLGQSTTLTATGAVSYTWQPGSLNGPSIVVSPTETTTYTVMATDPSGCVLNDQVIVTVNPLPVISVSEDTLITEGTGAVLNVSGADTYFWSPGLLSGESVNVAPVTTTVYTATGTYATTGCSSNAEVEVSVVATPKVSGSMTILKGSTTTLTASGPIVAAFFWYDAPTGGNILSFDPIFTSPPLDTNTIFYVALSDGNATSERLPVHIMVVDSDISEATATELTICPNGSTELVANMNTPGTINWYDAESNGNLIASIPSGTSYSIEPDSTTTYYAEGVTDTVHVTYNYTGAPQTFIVPEGVISLNFNAFGAQGGDTYSTTGPGLGGQVEGNISVTPGQELTIYIGGVGQSYAGYSGQLLGGWNGGGNGTNTGQGGGGGGATDIRFGGTTLLNRIVIAGGAGGKGPTCSAIGLKPHGGGLIGGAGSYCNSGPGELKRGLGGTQTEGGRRGCWYNNSSCGGVGSYGQGGNGGSVSGNGRSGGGGGGYYGGGGGTDSSDGGGGSSYTHPFMHNPEHTQGVREGHGMLILSYSLMSVSDDLVPVTITVEDTISPQAMCVDVSLFLDEQGQATLEAETIDLNSTDNCMINSMSISQSSFDCSDKGSTIPVTLSVFDDMNNSASCIAQVTVNDTLAPIASCIDVSLSLNEQAKATLEVTTIDLNSSDNCMINTMSISQDTFDCSDLGTTIPVTLTVFDEENNSSTCISQVTINDVQYDGQRKVLNPNNDGSESLRQVISDACPEDVIFFQNELLGDTIKLESPILLMDKNISIHGLGINMLPISGNKITNVFQIGSGINITLQDMDIIDGILNIELADGDSDIQGSGIDNKGNLILENVVFNRNSSLFLLNGIPQFLSRSDIYNSSGGLLNVKSQVKIEE